MFYVQGVAVSRRHFMCVMRLDLRGTGRVNIRKAFKWMREYGVYRKPEAPKKHTPMPWGGVSLVDTRHISTACSVRTTREVKPSIAAQNMRRRLVSNR